MDITVNVDNVDLNTIIGEGRRYDDDTGQVLDEPRTIGDAVVTQIAERLWSTYRNGELTDVNRRISTIRDEEIRAKVGPVIEAALAKGVPLTNGYGEPTGKVTSVTELIVKEANAYLTRPADQYDRSGQTVIQKLVKEQVEQVIGRELVAAIAEEKAKVVAAVRAKAADLIATAVKEGVGR